VARGMSLGHTRQLPAEDRYLETYSRYKDMLATLMGGRVAEELVFNEMSTGAAHDIKVATDYAHKMVTEYGMSDKLGPRTFGNKQEMVFLGREIAEQRDYGDKIANLIDEEVHKIITQAYEKAKDILNENKQRLTHIAEKLVVRETLEGEELEAMFSEPVPTTQPEARETPVPTPVREKAKAKPRPVSRKAPGLRRQPKQAPATS